jgi:hypothetical protein
VTLAEAAGPLETTLDRQAALAEVPERLAELLMMRSLRSRWIMLGLKGRVAVPSPSVKGGGGAIVRPAKYSRAAPAISSPS